MTSQTETPLVLIAFNRPQLLRKQLEIVRDSFKGPIFVIIDGPRPHVIGEPELVAQVASLADELCNQFDCQVNKSSENLGCYKRIKSGLDWVFSQVDRAIILEDDCMPSPQFFSFASEMLERYADDERIYSISGTNLFPRLSSFGQRYFFSRYHNCWGWATWARAWKGFIDEKDDWNKIRGSKEFRGIFRNLRSLWYWRHILDQTYSEQINSWAYRWMLSCWMKSGLSICAHVNLVTNVGDDAQATRTKGSSETRRPVGELLGKLSDPEYIISNSDFDKKFEDVVFSKSLRNRSFWIFKKLNNCLSNKLK